MVWIKHFCMHRYSLHVEINNKIKLFKFILKNG